MRTSHTITRFKGIMSGDSITNITPDSAIDCLNVFGDRGGWLQRFNQPSTLLDFATVDPSNLAPVFALAFLPTLSNPRLLIQQGLTLYFSDYPYSSATAYTSGVFPGIIHRMDFVLSNGLSYFTNGQGSGYTLPPSPTLDSAKSSSVYQWGISPAPAAPVSIPATCSITGSVTIQRTANVLTVTTVSPHGASPNGPYYIDDDPNAAWTTNGTHIPGLYRVATVSSSTVLTIASPGPNEGPFVRGSFAKGLTATSGYSFGFSYGSSPVSHFSSLSSLSASTGPLTLQSPVLLIPPSTDPQVNTAALFRNQDGGGDFYLTNDSASVVQQSGVTSPLPASSPYAGSYLFVSTTTDLQLSTSGLTAPYDNGLAPLGKYIAVWLDRILMTGIASDPTAVRFSGFDSINIGRPQMCWPQYNNIRLGQGEAEPMGMGLLRYGGMVFFATNGLMYIYRGSLNDITVSSPTSLSFYAEQLPYKIGLYSHFSIQSTPAGLVWLDDGFNLRVYENSGFYPPRTLSASLSGILRRITPGSQDAIESAYVNILQHDWYILSIPLDGSPTPNCTIIVDLDQDPARNTGAWPTSHSINGAVWLTYTDGSRHLIATLPVLSVASPSLVGYLAEIPLIDNIQQGMYDDRHSPTSGVTPTPPLPGAFWRSGYFGIHDADGEDAFSYMKLFRYCRLTGSISGDIGMTAFLVDSDNSTFDFPQVIPMEIDGMDGGLNAKARAASILLSFPDSSSPVPTTLTSFLMAYNLTGIR